jgi:hypothetical protein
MDKQLYRLALLDNGKEDLYTARSPIHGTGLFTYKDLPTDTLICRLMNIDHHPAPDDWLVEPFKWVNHACPPNARLTNDHALISVSDIKADEEICIDYQASPVNYYMETVTDTSESKLPLKTLTAEGEGITNIPAAKKLFKNPFRSFWMGGFECTDQLNNAGDRVDLLLATRHLEFLEEDYLRLKAFGILTVREGIRWSQVEKLPYQYDFSNVAVMLDVAKRHGIQQIWDICHFGFPDDLSPLHPQFTERFVSLCRAFALFHRQKYPQLMLIVTPVNEVSFLSWLGGEVAGTVPYLRDNGWKVKYHLMKAYIAGIKAFKLIDFNIRILTTEPLVNIVPPLKATLEEIEQARTAHQEQYQSLDILIGSICPELGGSPDLVDMLGFNFYYNNQWLAGFESFLPWLNREADPRWRPLHSLLEEAYLRYGKPVVLTETSHPGEDRPKWVRFIAEQCQTLLEKKVPFYGICLYPVIDRPDWDNLDYWHHSGLWDREADADESTARVLNAPYADALRSAQQLLNSDRNS